MKNCNRLCKLIVCMLIALPLGLLLGQGSTGTKVVSAESVLSNVEIATSYLIGDSLTVPDATINYQGKDYEAHFSVLSPDGNVYIAKTLLLKDYGKYCVEYSTIADDGNRLSHKVFTDVHNKLYNVNDDKSIATYGEHHQYLGREGVMLSLRGGDTFRYNRIIDIKDFAADESLLSFFVTPETVGAVDATKINFILTDAYNADNQVTITLKKHDAQGQAWAEINSYIVVSGTNQTPRGLEQHKDGTIVIDSKKYRMHVNNSYGAPVQFAMTAAPNYTDDVADYTPGTFDNHNLEVLFNASTSMVSARFRTGGAYKSVPIADLDSAEHFGNALWSGFTTGEAFLSVTAEGYRKQAVGIVFTKLGKDSGPQLKSNMFYDQTPPALEVDTLGYSVDNLPYAVVGEPYKFFAAKALDANDGIQPVVDVKVYMNYGKANQVNVDVTDGSFIPEYRLTHTIVYTVSDRSGNMSTQSFDIKVMPKGQKPVLNIGNAPKTAEVCEKATVAGYTYSGNSGDAAVSVKAVHKQKPEVVYHIGADLDFYPIEPGDYDIVYSYQDYVFSFQETYVLKATAVDKIVFLEGASVHPYMIKGAVYTFPSLTATVYKNGKKSELMTKIQILEEGLEPFYLPENKYVSYGDTDITVKYVAEAHGMISSMDYIVKVIDVGYGGRLNLSSYFHVVSGGTAVSKTDNIMLTATAANARFDFINALIIGEFTTAVNLNNFGNSSVIKYVLMGRDDHAQTVEFEVVNSQGQLVLIVGGRVVQTGKTVASITKDLVIDYNNTLKTITLTHDSVVIASVSVADYIDNFKGIDGGFGYLTIGLNGSGTAVSVKSLNNHNLSSPVDIISPHGTASPNAGDKTLGEKVTIKGNYLGDVLDPNVKGYMTVMAPDGTYVTSDDGTMLNKYCDYTNDYVITLTKYGKYLVQYYAEDTSGNVMDYSFIYTVVDVDPPVITLGKAVTSARKGSVIRVAEVTITDNLDSEVNYNIMVKTPEGAVLMIEHNAFRADYAGEYTIYIYAYDARGNYTSTNYMVKVS